MSSCSSSNSNSMTNINGIILLFPEATGPTDLTYASLSDIPCIQVVDRKTPIHGFSKDPRQITVVVPYTFKEVEEDVMGRRGIETKPELILWMARLVLLYIHNSLMVYSVEDIDENDQNDKEVERSSIAKSFPQSRL